MDVFVGDEYVYVVRHGQLRTDWMYHYSNAKFVVVGTDGECVVVESLADGEKHRIPRSEFDPDENVFDNWQKA